MKQVEALEIITQSESFSKQLKKIEIDVLTWADSKQKLYKMFFKQASRYKTLIRTFSEEWSRDIYSAIQKDCINTYMTTWK